MLLITFTRCRSLCKCLGATIFSKPIFSRTLVLDAYGLHKLCRRSDLFIEICGLRCFLNTHRVCHKRNRLSTIKSASGRSYHLLPYIAINGSLSQLLNLSLCVTVLVLVFVSQSWGQPVHLLFSFRVVYVVNSNSIA